MADADIVDDTIQPASTYNITPSAPTTDDGESSENCRICRGGATPEQPLFYPCKCSGSIKYVHQECLMEWLSHSQKKYCELCKTPFTFTKLYHQSMPERLPVPLFLRQISMDGLQACAKWLRYVLVTLVWICWLPWSIRQVWRGLFWLADGSWMTAQDFQQLVAENTSSFMSNATTPSRNHTLDSASTFTTTLVFQNPLAFLLDLFTGDALLRALLRLISQKSASTVNPGEPKDYGNFTLTLTAQRSDSMRGPSILSGVETLNSFTKYTFVNNALVDVLEGQLICLAIITVFILIFLIREWVLNQQPNAGLPDQDPAELQAGINNALVGDGRAGGLRRRRAGLRRLPEEGAQAADRPMGAGERPRAILRPRRAATDDNAVHQPEMAGEDRPLFPPRATSLVSAGSSTFDTPQPSTDSAASRPAQVASDPHHIRTPPLQRGMFDEVVDIRRNIEERSSTNIAEQEDQSASFTQTRAFDFAHPHPPSNPSFMSSNPNLLISSELPEPSDPESSGPHNREAQSESIFRFSSNTDGSAPFSGSVVATTQEPDDYIAVNNQAAEQQDGLNAEWVDITNQEPASTQTSESTDITPTSSAQGDPSLSPSDSHDSLMSDLETANPAPLTLFDKIVNWLWPMDQHVPILLPTTTSIPTGDTTQIVRDIDAEAPFVPVNAPEAAPPAPAHEPNVQFGVDLNDPNMMDEAEELEGILELMGLEGPLIGMIQNTVFSLFLISLTLSASVWCPYIWGKIAFLVMSNPIGVFFKAPLYFISRVADVLVDIMLLTIGAVGFLLTKTSSLLKTAAIPILPTLAKFIKVEALEASAIKLSRGSSARLEKALSVTVFHLRPDLPTFSVQSHHVLQVFEGALSQAISAISNDLLDTINAGELLWRSKGVIAIPVLLAKEVIAFPTQAFAAIQHTMTWLQNLSNDLKMPSFSQTDTVDYQLINWSSKDRTTAIVAGYVFFGLAGVAYLKISRIFYGLGKDEKVEGVLADSLRQAGGVLKVIFIIGIEMIAFPLYCGCLLDIALLPLFKDATIKGRLTFIGNAPATGLFVHWFLGTCYMFHFALFVSMCRKILRRGVLYFIRDPDDPTFHPVRDVLERRVLTQLSKIAWSAGVYGGLVTLCLGVVIWTLTSIGGVFPIEWSAHEPRLGFPVDILFFNFVLPFILRTAEPSKKISTMYEWWFRICARTLKLSHFLFGENRDDEMRATSVILLPQLPVSKSSSDEHEVDSSTKSEQSTGSINGTWVRAPAADQVRIPKGAKAFLEVNENNERLDGQPELAKGLHGKDDERFTKIFIPTMFKYRITTFVFLVWLFASCTGVAFSVGPLLVGRRLIKMLANNNEAPNDLYAFTVGMQICGAVAYLIAKTTTYDTLLCGRHWTNLLNLQERFPQVYRAIKRSLGILYLVVIVGVIIPISLSLVAEVYVHMPVYNVISRSAQWRSSVTTDQSESKGRAFIPTIYLVQSWTLGLLYLRLLIRIATTYPSSHTRVAFAIQAIVARSFFRPHIWLATRAFIIPVLTCIMVSLTVPLGLAKLVILTTGVTDETSSIWIYRYSYPTLLIFAFEIYILGRLKSKITRWQVRVRDEIYLVGERLHNFAESPEERAKREQLSGAAEKTMMIEKLASLDGDDDGHGDSHGHGHGNINDNDTSNDNHQHID